MASCQEVATNSKSCQKVAEQLVAKASYTREGTTGNSGWGCAAQFSKSWPYFRPKNVIFHTLFQTIPLKSIPVFRPESANTLIHSRSSLKNLTRFQTKMGKVYIRFQTVTVTGVTGSWGAGKLWNKLFAEALNMEINCMQVKTVFGGRRRQRQKIVANLHPPVKIIMVRPLGLFQRSF